MELETSGLLKSETDSKPANIYYFRPYRPIWAILFLAGGAALCSTVTTESDLDTKYIVILWVVYVVGISVGIIIDPNCCTQSKRMDESGRTIELRRPIIGFRSTEHMFEVDRLVDGLYDQDKTKCDPRFGDGYRYGFAHIRI